jgi:hypothetical protein
MGIEDQIAARLQQGAAPRQLISEGFRKSTVYKVAETLRAQQAPAPPPPLLVSLTTDRDRYLPGETAHATVTVSNRTKADLYVFQAGVRPEWVEGNTWIPTTLRKLINPGDAASIRLPIPIPADTPLGEKELFVGVQGQWLGPDSHSPSNEIMWAGPLLLRVQRPAQKLTVFIAHAVSDLSLISELESTLENNGIQTLVGDPISERALFASRVEAADIVVAILTSSHPYWHHALPEIAQVAGQDKELILLRDISLSTALPPTVGDVRWIDVDFSRGAASIVMRLFAELNERNLRRARRRKDQDDALGIVLLALGALAAGIALSKGRAPGG